MLGAEHRPLNLGGWRVCEMGAQRTAAVRNVKARHVRLRSRHGASEMQERGRPVVKHSGAKRRPPGTRLELQR